MVIGRRAERLGIKGDVKKVGSITIDGEVFSERFFAELMSESSGNFDSVLRRVAGGQVEGDLTDAVNAEIAGRKQDREKLRNRSQFVQAEARREANAKQKLRERNEAIERRKRAEAERKEKLEREKAQEKRQKAFEAQDGVDPSSTPSIVETAAGSKSPSEPAAPTSSPISAATGGGSAPAVSGAAAVPRRGISGSAAAIAAAPPVQGSMITAGGSETPHFSVKGIPVDYMVVNAIDSGETNDDGDKIFNPTWGWVTLVDP